MDYVCIPHEFPMSKDDLEAARKWATNMASFYNHTIDHVRKTYYKDGKRIILPRVHGIWDAVKDNTWARRITTSWAWYSIADAIDLVQKYDFKKGDIDWRDPWPVSVKTLRWSDKASLWRLIIPGNSIEVTDSRVEYDNIFGGCLWSGSGRVQIGEDDRLWFTLYCLQRGR